MGEGETRDTHVLQGGAIMMHARLACKEVFGLQGVSDEQFKLS